MFEKFKFPLLSFALVSSIFLAPVTFGSEALYKAVQQQDEAGVARELKSGADANYFKKGAFTALGMAAYKGNAAIVEMLLQAGANADQPVRNNSEDRPLSLAAIANIDASKTIDVLIAAGAETEFESGEWVMTPLQLAIMNHRTKNALAFIRNGVDLSAPDKVGDPALHGAIYQKNETVVRALLDKGVDPSVLNDSGENAFQFSKKWDREAFALPILLEFHPEFCETNTCDPK